jgi:hypothetical protein
VAGWLGRLLIEYERARAWTDRLTDDLSDDHWVWRPEPASSAIGWHLGHQGVVNHVMIRNLLLAEPSPDPALESIFDSATPEVARGDLPARDRVAAYRRAVGERTRSMIGGLADHGSEQSRLIATGVLVAVINHEYQHDTWVGEMRQRLGHDLPPGPPSEGATLIDGYWVVIQPELPD